MRSRDRSCFDYYFIDRAVGCFSNCRYRFSRNCMVVRSLVLAFRIIISKARKAGQKGRPERQVRKMSTGDGAGCEGEMN